MKYVIRDADGKASEPMTREEIRTALIAGKIDSGYTIGMPAISVDEWLGISEPKEYEAMMKTVASTMVFGVIWAVLSAVATQSLPAIFSFAAAMLVMIYWRLDRLT